MSLKDGNPPYDWSQAIKIPVICALCESTLEAELCGTLENNERQEYEWPHILVRPCAVCLKEAREEAEPK